MCVLQMPPKPTQGPVRVYCWGRPRPEYTVPVDRLVARARVDCYKTGLANAQIEKKQTGVINVTCILV